ncbi:MAG: P-loop NTPase fold protein [Candidatus Thiodiazotropha taylori]
MTDKGLFLFPDSPADLNIAGRMSDYASYIASAIKRDVEVFAKHPFAVGIYGGWGSGKTTLMRAVENEIKSEARQGDFTILTVWLNVWRYQGEGGMVEPLAMEIAETLTVKPEDSNEIERIKMHLLEELPKKGAFKNFIESFDKLGFSILGNGFNISHKWKMSWNIRNFSQSCMNNKNAYKAFFVVFVDDLDRCSPDTVVATLEAIKGFFDLGGFLFVVGVDDFVVKRIIDEQYKKWSMGFSDGGDDSGRIRGADYLEKMFPLTLRVNHDDHSNSGKGAVQSFVEEWIKDLSSEKGEALVVESPLSEIITHAEYLFRRSTLNPRELKRFINHCLLAHYSNDAYGNKEKAYARLVIEHHKKWDLVQKATSEYGDIFWDALALFFADNRRAALSDLDAKLQRLPRTFLDYVNARRSGPGSVMLGGFAENEEGQRQLKLYDRAFELHSFLDDFEDSGAAEDFAQRLEEFNLSRQGVENDRFSAGSANVVSAGEEVLEKLKNGTSFSEIEKKQESLRFHLESILKLLSREALLDLARKTVRLRGLLNRMNREEEGDTRAVESVQLAAAIEQQLAILDQTIEKRFPDEPFRYQLGEYLELLQKEMTRFRQERPYTTTESFGRWLTRTNGRVGDLLKDLAGLIPPE